MHESLFLRYGLAALILYSRTSLAICTLIPEFPVGAVPDDEKAVNARKLTLREVDAI